MTAEFPSGGSRLLDMLGKTGVAYAMGNAGSVSRLKPEGRNSSSAVAFIPRALAYGCAGVILFFLFSAALGPANLGGIRQAHASSWMQMSRQIDLALFMYATDHNGKYPEGESSTEVFQKLMNENYISDAAIFFVSLPGKTEAKPGQKLKPENVCWDVTSGLESSSPDELPVVFLTGYKVNYVPGGSAVALIKPYPAFGFAHPRTWAEWWQGKPAVDEPGPYEVGIAVTYKSNLAAFKRLDFPIGEVGQLSNFISPSSKPDGKTYRQLTPHGLLP